ncbi:hypothetical protein Trydic_g22739 [Trypoxylus dichotomus]
MSEFVPENQQLLELRLYYYPLKKSALKACRLLTLEELAAALDLGRFTVGSRLYVLGMVQKAGNWVPYELKERDIGRRLVMCEMLLQRQQRKTGDEKLIHYDSPKCKLAWTKLGEPGPSPSKRNI